MTSPCYLVTHPGFQLLLQSLKYQFKAYKPINPEIDVLLLQEFSYRYLISIIFVLPLK